MARMFPDVAVVKAESRAEQKLYLLFKKELPDEFYVFHSVSYVLSGGRTAQPRRGEADFVIAHPQLGFLVVEVKGGGVTFDQKLGRWESQGRTGTRKIKNPFKQAERCLAHLQEAVERARLLPHALPAGYCVALPDCQTAGTGIEAWGQTHLVIDGSHLTRLRERVEQIMGSFARKNRALPAGTFRALCQQVLAPRFDLALRLGGEIEWEKAAFALLSEDQSICLDFLELNQRSVVQGPAGTGKTVVAVEHARRLASQGRNVLLVCYNLPLAEHLKRMVASFECRERIWAGAYHQLCEEWVRQAGLQWREPADTDSKRDFWDSETTLLLLEAMKSVDRRFDALIVDEAQDMHPDWWESLTGLLHEPERGYLALFCDPYQNIYDRPEQSLPLSHPVFPLRTNCRNTRLVSEFFMKLVGAPERYSVLAGAGSKPRIRRYRTPQEQVEQIEKDIDWLVRQQGISAERIMLLGTRRLEKSCLAGVPALADCPVVPADPSLDARPGTLRYSTLHRYKGLEADVVLFCDLDGNERNCTARHVYVGASRAKHRLFLYMKAGVDLPGARTS